MSYSLIDAVWLSKEIFCSTRQLAGLEVLGRWRVEHSSARRWQWAAEKLASHKFSERADVKFTTKNMTINWPDNP
jgi:hypothetical protein